MLRIFTRVKIQRLRPGLNELRSSSMNATAVATSHNYDIGQPVSWVVYVNTCKQCSFTHYRTWICIYIYIYIYIYIRLLNEQTSKENKLQNIPQPKSIKTTER